MRTQVIFLALATVLSCGAAAAQWVEMYEPGGHTVQALAVSGKNLFVGTYGDGFYRSTNNGFPWTAPSSGLTDSYINALAVSGTNLFAGTNAGVFLSTDNGTNWTAVNSGFSGSYSSWVVALAVSGTNLFAGTDGSGAFLSTDKGTSWTAVNYGLTNMTGVVTAFAVSGPTLFAGTDEGVYLSTNNGTSWTDDSSGLVYNAVNALAVIYTNVFAGTYGGGVFVSATWNTSWTAYNYGLTNKWVLSLAVSGTNLFAGTYGDGVFLSTDYGASWTAVGLTGLNVHALAVGDTNLYAGASHDVWMRPLAEMVTSVKSTTSEVPRQFELQQNYPNPFNPSTTIKFELPRASQVNLTVYDILGREVSVLVNERRDAGVYGVKFDGSNLASGVYFYRLQAGDFLSTKKMLVLK